MVMETSLTMVLAAPLPPPDPALSPADCEDDVADVADAADVDGAAEVDVVAVDGDVAAALDEAIALIDMKTSPEGSSTGAARSSAPSPSTR